MQNESLEIYNFFGCSGTQRVLGKGRSKKLCNTDRGSKSADRLFEKNGGRDSAGERQW